ncbi:MAG: CYTH domain-containing protein [Lutimonas sp.]
MSGKEVERKFLVKSDAYRSEAFKKEDIIQGFLSSVPERTVRIRKVENLGWITIKGIGNASGTTRFEWEKEISGAEAQDLLELCEPGKIEKIRYYVQRGSHTFEVDEFQGENEGLVIAEIELAEEHEAFEHPLWLGNEVTGQIQYYNASLSKNPFLSW